MKSLFKISSILISILFVGLFIQFFFISNYLIELLGLQPTIASVFVARRISVVMLSIGVLMFGSRNLPHSRARQMICLFISFTLFGLLCMGSYEFINGTVNSSILVSVFVETAFCVLFGSIYIMNKKTLTA
jgi:hypothetical protein